MRKAIVTLILVLALVGAGLIAMGALAGMKKPPVMKKKEIPAISVEAMEMSESNHATAIIGFGTCTSPDRISISAGVSGEVVEVSKNIEPGGRVEAEEILIVIDPLPYRLKVTQIEADIQRLTASRAGLAISNKADEQSLELVEKGLELAQSEYQRAKKLFDDGQVGSISTVESLERAVLSARERVVSLRAAIDRNPVKENEIDAQIASTTALLESAKYSLARTQIKSPISGRVESRAAEKGQLVSPGFELARIVDDSRIEIRVSIDSSDLAQWLPLSPPPEGVFASGNPTSEKVSISWVESPERFTFTGKAARIEKLDQNTRSGVVVVIADRPSGKEAPRLVEGMFCQVSMPGRELKQAVKVPRSAVGQDGTVLLVRDGKLARARTRVLRVDGENAFLEPCPDLTGLLILTRLLAPVEGVPVNATLVDRVQAETVK